MTIPRQAFGATGHESTRIIFGAAALFAVDQEAADRILEELLESGVNHIDVAASYGHAELRVGPWMREHRKHFFLATKTGERSYQSARDQIRASLERLQVEQIDLIQLHNLTDEAGWEQAFADDGALRACVEAREEGLVRFIGVTGHGTRVATMHLRSLERFPFDSVLLPYTFSMMEQPAYAASFEELLRVCAERRVAVQTIKAVARRRWGKDEKPTTLRSGGCVAVRLDRHSKHLAAMQQVADFGVLVVNCRGEWCSFASSTTRMNLELERLWPVVHQLVTS